MLLVWRPPLPGPETPDSALVWGSLVLSPEHFPFGGVGGTLPWGRPFSRRIGPQMFLVIRTGVTCVSQLRSLQKWPAWNGAWRPCLGEPRSG